MLLFSNNTHRKRERSNFGIYQDLSLNELLGTLMEKFTIVCNEYEKNRLLVQFFSITSIKVKFVAVRP